METIPKIKRVEYGRTSFAKRAADFIFKKLGIKKITFPVSEAASKESAFLVSKIVQHNVKNPVISSTDPTKSEEDMFKMKAIMLLKKHNLSTKMIDAFSSLQMGPRESSDVVAFKQLLEPLPGEEIELTGQFKRHVKRSIPLIETFRLQERSHQTGFPHPMQYTGFALSPSLLPSCPLRPENLPIFYQIHKKKEEAAVALLPRGRFNETAKKTLSYKAEAFNEKKEIFIALHEVLGLTFREDAPREFFEEALKAKDSYHFIASTYESFNKHFIKEAKDHLYQAHVSRFSFSSDASPLEELKEAYSHFINQKREVVDSPYIHFLSSVFEKKILALFLQEMSEIALFPPPKLTEADKIVQTALFRQLSAFLRELETPIASKEEAAEAIERELVEDIALFGRKVEESDPLLDELEKYYIVRQKTFIR